MKLNIEYLDNWEKRGEFLGILNQNKDKWATVKDGDEYGQLGDYFLHPFLKKDFLYVYDKETKEQIGWLDRTGIVYRFPWVLFSTEGNSGYDLRAAINEPIVIKPNERALIKNGIKISFGEGFDSNVEFQVRCRSGLAFKKGIMVVNGVGTVDYNYRGEVGTILYNSGTEDFVVNRGDRVSQAVICPIYKPEIVIVDKVDETDRGSNGYGSSGIK